MARNNPKPGDKIDWDATGNIVEPNAGRKTSGWLFNVKPPAMFKHYNNLDELKESLTLYGVRMLKQNLQDSVTGKSGEEALTALCHAYRNFAKSNHGVYQAIQPSYFGRNKEIEQAAMQLMAIIISVLKGFNVAEVNFIHLLPVQLRK